MAICILCKLQLLVLMVIAALTFYFDDGACVDIWQTKKCSLVLWTSHDWQLICLFVSSSVVLNTHWHKRRETGESSDTMAQSLIMPFLFPSFLPFYLLTMIFPQISFGWKKWYWIWSGRYVDVLSTLLKACFCNVCLYVELLRYG